VAELFSRMQTTAILADASHAWVWYLAMAAAAAHVGVFLWWLVK